MIGKRIGVDDLKVGDIVRRFNSSGGTLWQVTLVSDGSWESYGQQYREFCAKSLSSSRELIWEVTDGFEIVEPRL